MRRLYNQRLLAGKTNVPPSSSPPQQTPITRIRDLETFRNNAARHLMHWRNEWSHAVDEDRRSMMTDKSFKREYGPSLPPLRFVGEGEPIAPNVPYWKQLPTIASDPNFAKGESCIPGNEDPSIQYEPPTLEDLRKVPTQCLKFCTRCSSNTHPYYYCAKTFRNPESWYCAHCCLGGHQAPSCPSRKFYDREQSRGLIKDPNKLQQADIRKMTAQEQEEDWINNDVGLDTIMSDDEDQAVESSESTDQDFRQGLQH